jgi:hypothetical protein
MTFLRGYIKLHIEEVMVKRVFERGTFWAKESVFKCTGTMF